MNEQTTTETEPKLKKGDLFYTSWGYDQTNYDYLVVEEVSKTGKTAKCRMTSALNMGTSGQSNVQEPVYCPYGETFRMYLRPYNGKTYLTGSYPYCNGYKRLDQFSQVKPNEQFFETMTEFGH